MSHHLIQASSVVTDQLKEVPEFKVGSLVSVHYKIIEGTKERVQIFKGIVIDRHEKKTINATFTVLKNSTAGVKVERNYPLFSPLIVKIEVHSDEIRTRKAYLGYLHNVKDPNKAVRTKSTKKPATASTPVATKSKTKIAPATENNTTTEIAE
jgi:large subunit ribosomal protein L19